MHFVCENFEMTDQKRPLPSVYSEAKENQKKDQEKKIIMITTLNDINAE